MDQTNFDLISIGLASTQLSGNATESVSSEIKYTKSRIKIELDSARDNFWPDQPL